MRCGSGIEFGFKQRKLRFAELLAFRIGKQAVSAAGDVADVECDRGDSRRTSVELCFGERGAPAVEVFLSSLKSVEYGALRGSDVGECASQPWFGKFGLVH